MLWRVPIHAGFHSRGYLPHLKVPGAAYFVTFRLSDSLPREVIRRLKEQREDLLRRAIAVGEVEIDSRRQELFRWYATEIDSLLDQHTGAAWLRDERIASLVAGALRHFRRAAVSPAQLVCDAEPCACRCSAAGRTFSG
jgi:hypothetical protein